MKINFLYLLMKWIIGVSKVFTKKLKITFASFIYLRQSFLIKSKIH